MMFKSSSNVFLSIGKPVKDEHGRQIGKVASFQVNPNGRVEQVYIEEGNGAFTSYPIDQAKIDDAGVVLLSQTKVKIDRLCDEIPLIWRKDQALSELKTKNKITPDMYGILHSSFEGALNQLKAEAEASIEMIDAELENINAQTKNLNSALINLEIEKEIGKIDEKSYQNALSIIQENLKWSNIERNDLESTKTKLSNILLGDKPSTSVKTADKQQTKENATTTAESQTLPEPPVMVYVKGSN